ncbi:MAG: tautomerase family protein [Planctomycetota bacterium]|jgi:4-oxalocrotonate tautomerase
MPTLTVEGPGIEELDEKRQLVKDVTEAATTAFGLSEEVIVVVIKENAPDNICVGGQLIIDRLQQKPDIARKREAVGTWHHD